MNKKSLLQKKMRKSAIILSLTILSLFIVSSARASSPLDTNALIQQLQNKKITINIKNSSAKVIISEIQKKSGMSFIFHNLENEKELSNLSLNVKNKNVLDALDTLFANTKFTYAVVGNTITIIKKKENNSSVKSRVDIAGRIVDTDNRPISGATIIVVGTNIGGISDGDGKFTLKANVGDVLEVTYIGMKDLKYTIAKAENNLVLKLVIDAMAVDEVIVTGIFDKSKETYTGSVVTVTAKELKMYKGQNIINTLRNVDPSLNIVANNIDGSNPNKLPEINIRGNSTLPKNMKDLNDNTQAQLNTPLIIMNGFEISLQKMIDLNEEEIETISILKDASATAIYGSRGSNGIIVITTKVPVEGKLNVSVNASFNVEMPDLTSYDILNAREKLDLEFKAGLYVAGNGDASGFKSLQRYENILKEVMAGVDTDWMVQPVRTGVGQRYNINLSGGSSSFRWSTSVAYGDTKGAMKGSDKKTISGNINLTYQLKNISFKNQTIITNNKGTESKYGAFKTYVNLNPYYRIKDSEGDYKQSYELPDGTIIQNPLNDVGLNTINTNNYFDVTNNLAIDWKICDELKVLGKFGFAKSVSNSDRYLPASHSSFKNYKEEDYFRKGSYRYTNGNGFNYDATLTINYAKTIAEKHQIYAGLNLSLLERNSYNYTFLLEGYNNDDFNFLGNANFYDDNKPSGSEELNRSIGITANVNYSYDNRYFADFSFRTDGSSQFGKDQRFAPFWSMGIGWNIHREKFLKESKVISNFRIKGSYGETGSQTFSPYQALSTYNYFTEERYLNWNGAYLMSLSNPNLKWQKTRQINAGLEMSFLNNRFSASADIYNKTTTNSLSQKDLPKFHGFTSYTENVGSVINKGFEAMMRGYVIRDTEREIIWSISAKLSYNKSKIGKLPEAIKQENEEALKSSASNSRLLFEGDPSNALYAVQSFGIDPSSGKEVYLDRFGDITYKWDARDRVYVGVNQPLYRGNISTMFTYKNITLNLSFGYHWGGVEYNNTLINKVENANILYNVDARVYNDRWMKAGDIVAFGDIKSRTSAKTNYSTRFVQDDNMFTLQSASLSYRFSPKWLKEKTHISAVNFGCNTSDIFYLSSIKRERGTDYPFARRIGFTLSLQF